MKMLALLLAGVTLAATCQGQSWLDGAEEKLSLRTKDGFFRADLSGLLDLEGYYVDQRPPGLLFGSRSFINPRATFFIDAKLGEHFYGFLQARVDRGFDPLYRNFDARLDEYFIRWTPFHDSRLSLQAGKFATVVGSWVQRHDSWQNPLITAPLAYENMTVVSDSYSPTSPADFLARRSLADEKEEWVPVIWGPVYATGGAVLGSIGKLDYAIEVKNAALSSRPEEWDPVDDSDNLWNHPTFSGRLGFRPSPAWNHGISLSRGSYILRPQPFHAPSQDLPDFAQMTIGYDVSYAWRAWQFWGEVFLNRFEVPGVGNADLISYYLEAKYKLTSALFAAARWNQEISGTVPDGAGGRQTWDRNMIRIDLALGYRFTRHLQGKLQYSFGHRDARLQQGEQLVAAQVTLKY
jgi:hypothetical protein